MPDQVDADALPPTQYLLLEVLAARHRTGEHLWTFPARPAIRAAVDQLARLGLVGWKGGIEPKTIRAWLTDAGKLEALLDGYESPDFKRGFAAGEEQGWHRGFEHARRCPSLHAGEVSGE